SVAAGESYQAGMRSLYELSDHAGSSKSSSDSWVVSDNASVVQALNKTASSAKSVGHWRLLKFPKLMIQGNLQAI
ncbi:MAG: hypothetical protein FD188_3404, partial [Ignavibacteria bacterium]